MHDKIRNPFCIRPGIIVIFFTLLSAAATAQDSSLQVTKQATDYRKQVKDDAGKRMVELKKNIAGLVYDLRYATTNNFMHRRMYPKGTARTFLRLPAAEALKKVQEELARQGLGLKIFDAYRPYSVTVLFWELVKDERYVANPAKGSGHNRGIAVDLTLIKLADGTELDMGTGFDNFTDTAHFSFTALSPEVLQNRRLLRNIMEKNGFRAIESEWWHFYLPPSSRFEVLDLDFKKLEELNDGL